MENPGEHDCSSEWVDLVHCNTRELQSYGNIHELASHYKLYSSLVCTPYLRWTINLCHCECEQSKEVEDYLASKVCWLENFHEMFFVASQIYLVKGLESIWVNHDLDYLQ